MLPDFLVIGAMKSGTTSLYRYLLTHPEVSGVETKEPEFFSKNYDRGLEWYKGLFSGDGRLSFEASTGYTKRQFWPEAAERIYRDLPEVKLIYCLRDPVERTISNYHHNVQQGREKLSFSQAIRKPGNGYVATSLYAYQLEAYRSFYLEGRLHVLDFEAFKASPSRHMEKVLEFLGLAPDYDRAVLETVFHRSAPREFEVSEEDVEYLREVLGPDVERLRQVTGLAFETWCL